jgi:hypothetical protein
MTLLQLEPSAQAQCTSTAFTLLLDIFRSFGRINCTRTPLRLRSIDLTRA